MPHPNIKLSLRERFDFYVSPEPNTGCWLWTGGERGKSAIPIRYGGFLMDGVPVLAHRASWTLHRGPIPDGPLVCHRCDFPPCVNPDHLFLGTVNDNSLDMLAKGRWQPFLGELNGNHKLTEPEIRLIRLALGRESTYVTASRFGVSQKLVMNIQHRRIWRHVA